MVKEIAGAEFTTVHSYWVYCDDVICPDRMSRYIYGSLMKSTSMFLFRQWRHVPSDVTEIFGTKSVRFFGPHTRSIYSVGPPFYPFHHIFLTPRETTYSGSAYWIIKTISVVSQIYLNLKIWLVAESADFVLLFAVFWIQPIREHEVKISWNRLKSADSSTNQILRFR